MPKRYRTPTRTVTSTNPPRTVRDPAKPPKTWPDTPREPALKRNTP